MTMEDGRRPGQRVVDMNGQVDDMHQRPAGWKDYHSEVVNTRLGNKWPGERLGQPTDTSMILGRGQLVLSDADCNYKVLSARTQSIEHR